jgi:transposase
MVALGRKNWLFAGSDAGGRRAATLYSLVATCKHIGVDPFAYLRDVLARISTHPMRRIEELTPRGWQVPQLAVTPA